MEGERVITKQEIIDLIETDVNDGGCWVDFFGYGGTYCFTNQEACDKLIQMIEDLKPEIKIKKLVYMEDDNPNGPDYYTGTAQHYKIAECGLRRFWISRTDLDCKEPFLVYDSLQEAQDHVQKLWDEYVLSWIEVKNENN